VSITPLREALRRLEAEEFVALNAHKIVTVNPLTWQELHDLFVTRQQLDPLAASLAASESTGEETKTIATLASQPRPPDLGDRLTAHREFHLAIYRASHNNVLAAILSQLWDRTNRYRITVLRDRGFDHGTGKEHRQIAKAIRDRDSDLAADLMRNHIEEALHTFESIAMPQLGKTS
jgi:DNA-binding GntR family transcriptional regulator